MEEKSFSQDQNDEVIDLVEIVDNGMSSHEDASSSEAGVTESDPIVDLADRTEPASEEVIEEASQENGAAEDSAPENLDEVVLLCDVALDDGEASSEVPSPEQMEEAEAELPEDDVLLLDAESMDVLLDEVSSSLDGGDAVIEEDAEDLPAGASEGESGEAKAAAPSVEAFSVQEARELECRIRALEQAYAEQVAGREEFGRMVALLLSLFPDEEAFQSRVSQIAGQVQSESVISQFDELENKLAALEERLSLCEGRTEAFLSTYAEEQESRLSVLEGRLAALEQQYEAGEAQRTVEQQALFASLEERMQSVEHQLSETACACKEECAQREGQLNDRLTALEARAEAQESLNEVHIMQAAARVIREEIASMKAGRAS